MAYLVGAYIEDRQVEIKLNKQLAASISKPKLTTQYRHVLDI
jgi:hypothetical protein